MCSCGTMWHLIQQNEQYDMMLYADVASSSIHCWLSQGSGPTDISLVKILALAKGMARFLLFPCLIIRQHTHRFWTWNQAWAADCTVVRPFPRMFGRMMEAIAIRLEAIASRLEALSFYRTIDLLFKDTLSLWDLSTCPKSIESNPCPGHKQRG